MQKPKRPMTAFMLFSTERRPELCKTFQDVGELAKRLGQEWRNMTDEKKRVYLDRADQKHQEYKKLKKEYEKQKPKRPRTAYALFLKQNRSIIAKKFPNALPMDLMKCVAKEWKTLHNKEKYYKMAKEDRERWAI